MNTLLRLLVPGVLFLSACAPQPAMRTWIRPAPPPIGLDEVTRLADAGISDRVILGEIKNRGMSARPTSDQIVALKKEGVSDAVLQALNEAPLRADREVFVESGGPPPYAYDYYPYSYYPYPGYYPYYWPWYGGSYWGFYYHYPYYYSYPYGHGHVYGGGVHRYR